MSKDSDIWACLWIELDRSVERLCEAEEFDRNDISLAESTYHGTLNSILRGPDESFIGEGYVYARAAWGLSRKIREYSETRNLTKLAQYWEEFSANLQVSSLNLSEELTAPIEEAVEKLLAIAGEPIYSSLAEEGAAADGLILQVGEDLLFRAARNPEIMRKITPRAFEELMAEVFDSFGYEVELTAPSRDGGVDLIAVRQLQGIPFRLLVECKRYVPPNKIGVGRVRELWGVKSSRSASQALLVTTSYFTRGAEEFQRRHLYELELKDFGAVTEWVQDVAKRRRTSTWNGRTRAPLK